MPDSVFGLPLHPLVVHATVVAVPSAAVTVLLAAVWPRFRRWAGLLPLGLATVSLVLVPVSTSTGESLQHEVGGSTLIEKHSELADGLLPWVIALVVMAAGLYWWHRRGSRERRGQPTWVPTAISAVAVLVALGTSVQVVLIGHSGAKAAWSDVAGQSSSTGPTGR